MIEDGLFAHLTGDSSLTPLIGTRVYAEFLPQLPEYPAIVYKRVSTSRFNDLGGPNDYANVRVQIDIWDEGSGAYKDVKALAALVRRSLNGFSGDLGGTGTNVFLISLDGGDTDLGEIDGEKILRRVSQDYIVTINET